MKQRLERLKKKWKRTKSKLQVYWKEPGKMLARFQSRRLRNSAWGRRLSDEEFLKRMFRLYMGKELDLDNPRTYNEKLQWLKLHDRNPEYVRLVDKVEFKKYISEKYGEEYVVPVIGVWDNVDDIDFDALPNKFVLKCTHDSGSFVVCTDKSKLDWVAVKKRMKKFLKREYFWVHREWPYKGLKPRIIAEQFLEAPNDIGVRNCKFFCFNGEPKFLLLGTHGTWDVDFYDMDFNHLPIQYEGPNSKRVLPKPVNFDKMVEMSKELSKGIPHVRVDFMETEGRFYLGELTFFTTSGFGKFNPEEWDLKIGEYLILPEQK